MSHTTSRRSRLAARLGGVVFGVTVLAATALFSGTAAAQNGNWITNAAGTYDWSAAGNWQNGVVADGANNTATFATAGLTGPVTVTLDTARTIGAVAFDNPSNTFGWSVAGGNALTLSTVATGGPTIAVNNAGITAAVAAPLAGVQGFTKTGAGTLFLTGNNTGLSGGITVAAGTLGVAGNALANPLGSNVVRLAGGTLQVAPDPSGGYNRTMVVPVGSTFATSGIDATMDGGTSLTGYTWYQQGQNPSDVSRGLPMGVTTGAFGPPFTMPPATGRNALLLDAGQTTGSLPLTTAVVQSQVSFLTASANATGSGVPTVTATLHYTDGTPDATGLTFTSPDWISGTGIAYGRISSGGYSFGGTLYAAAVANPHPASPIGRIDLSWAPGTNPNTHTVVFAVSGGTLSSTVQSFANGIVVAADSTVNVATAGGATLGNLSIGSNTLHLSGPSLPLGPSLAFGGVTLSGNPTFDVAAGTAVEFGPLGDGGTPRVITKGGAGTLTLAGPAPGLSLGTKVVLAAGRLDVFSATALGPAPEITINGGWLSLGATGPNQTFLSLAGSSNAAQLSLGNKALTVGGSSSTTYRGTITNGGSNERLIKVGSGKLILTNPATYFRGGVYVDGGTLAATNAGALGAGAVTLNGGTLSVGGGTTLGVTMSGFGGPGNGWTANGSATFPAANRLQLTPDSPGQAGSAWFNIPVLTRPFTLSFTYTVTGTVPLGNGITAGLQTAGLNALGGPAEGLGYAGIAPSMARALNLVPSNTVSGIGTGDAIVSNGVLPAMFPGSFIDFTAAPTEVTIESDGVSLYLSLHQGIYRVSTGAQFDLAGVLGSSAYLGFTAATGTAAGQQVITDFSFSSPAQNVYANDVTLAALAGTIQVAATPGVPSVTMGALTVSAANATLTVAADPGTAANLPFGLILGATTLNGSTTFNVVNNGTGDGTLTLGAVANGPATGSLVKSGPGTLVLSAAGTYAGPTTIAGGTLRVANAGGSATGSGPVTVAAGGRLAGGTGGGSTSSFADSTEGFISGRVTVQAGGTLAPGTGVAGLLTVGGGVDFRAGSTFAVGLGTANSRAGGSPADVNTNSRLVTPLDVLFDGALTVAIDGGGNAFATGAVYDYFLARDSGTGGGLPTAVTFAPVDFGSPASPNDFALSRSPDGRTIILTFTPSAVPEPGSFVLAGLTAACGLAWRRRRRLT